MKLSLSWIFDHIDADWKKQDVQQLVSLFNTTTAEIEGFCRISFNLSDFFIGKLSESSSRKEIKLLISELDQQVVLPARDFNDEMISTSLQDLFFMVKKDGEVWRWAKLSDFGVEQENPMPALSVQQGDLKGVWRNKFECEDVILEIDNKSITHRPDMWGHRGFAREIAAFLKLPFRSKQDFLSEVPVASFEKKSKQTEAMPFVVENLASDVCSRFSGLYFPAVQNVPSNLWISSRLLKVGSRPINGLIDLTNYVMLDWSQPVHLYDAEKVEKKRVVVRMAKKKEKLVLLDGVEINLTPEDLMIADSRSPMCLAGVRGGKQASVLPTTKSLFFEAANFDAGCVRRASQRHKVRTDSSMRFEKSLDSEQTVEAIQRFVKLLADVGIEFSHSGEIVVVGKPAKMYTIDVLHSFLEKRSGISFDPEKVIELLSRLEFYVEKTTNEKKEIVYKITIPSFRASKDVRIKEDILEEVVRCYGFDKITLQIPVFERKPFDLSPVTRLRKIKCFLAHAASMTEQQNYSFYNEQFGASLELDLKMAVSIVNPVSENYYRLIPSLIPGLLRNVRENHIHRDDLSFFECGRIWKQDEQQEVVEKKSVAGLFLKKRVIMDFYQYSHHVGDLLKALGYNLDDFEWKRADNPPSPWYRPYQTAFLKHGDQTVGLVGKADPLLLSKLDIGAPCDALIFELDGDFLLRTPETIPTYKPISKYQETLFDISLFVPLNVQMRQLHDEIIKTDDLIFKVELIDFFGKDVWLDVRAMTFRIWMVHFERTLEKSDIDAVWQKVVKTVEKLGARVRTQ